MKRNLFAIITFILLIAISLLFISGAVYYLTEKRLNRLYVIDVKPLKVATLPVDIDRGKHLFESVALCADCHKKDLTGKVLDGNRSEGKFVVPNLTAGEYTVAKWSEADLVSAVRHGIGRNGRPLRLHPSDKYFYLSDDDLAAIIEYIKSVPSIDSELPPSSIDFRFRFLLIFSNPSPLIAETIDHKAPRPMPPDKGVTTEYGRYLTIIGRCFDCHGSDLTGLKQQNFQPKIQTAPDISMVAGAWSKDDFLKIMREGIKPDGSKISTAMPWELTAGMTNDELHAILLYLKTFLEKRSDDPANKQAIETVKDKRELEEIIVLDK